MTFLNTSDFQRIPPKDAIDYAWNAFEKWADGNRVGTHEDDWYPWWECWKTAYSRGYDRAEADWVRQ